MGTIFCNDIPKRVASKRLMKILEDRMNSPQGNIEPRHNIPSSFYLTGGPEIMKDSVFFEYLWQYSHL